MTAHSETRPLTILVNWQDFRMRRNQPRRRCGSRCTKHDPYPMVIQNLDGLVQPAEVEETLSWFQARPGKLCQAHGVNASLLHEFGINWPALSTPMFRVIIGAEECLIHHHHLVFSLPVVQYTVNFASEVSLSIAIEQRMTRWYELFVGNHGRRCRFIVHPVYRAHRRFIGPHTHQPQDKLINIRRGEGGAERRGGPSWSPASCSLSSHLGGTRSHLPPRA